jgi:hypothetical protein
MWLTEASCNSSSSSSSIMFQSSYGAILSIENYLVFRERSCDKTRESVPRTRSWNNYSYVIYLTPTMAESIPTITLADVSRIGSPPITRIKSDEDVELWKSKKSYQDYRIFLRRLNESVVGCTLPWDPEKRSQVESTYFCFSSRCSSLPGSWKNVGLTQHSWCVDRRDSTSQYPTTVWEYGFSDMESATGRGLSY